MENNHLLPVPLVKYQFYAIIYDVAGNTTPVGSSTIPAKEFSTNVQKVTGISISPSGSVTKEKGTTFAITPTITPNDANNKNVTYSSSDSSVASINSNGTVSCLKAGSTTITVASAENSNIKSTLALTVNDKVTITTFTYSPLSIKVGETATPSHTKTGTPKSGPIYTTSDSSIATVSSSGVVTGVKTGTVNITISYTNYDGSKSTKTCSLTIKSAVTIPSIAGGTTITCTSPYVDMVATYQGNRNVNFGDIHGTHTSCSCGLFIAHAVSPVKSFKAYSGSTLGNATASCDETNGDRRDYNMNTQCDWSDQGVTVHLGNTAYFGGGSNSPKYVWGTITLNNGGVINFETYKATPGDGYNYTYVKLW